MFRVRSWFWRLRAGLLGALQVPVVAAAVVEAGVETAAVLCIGFAEAAGADGVAGRAIDAPGRLEGYEAGSAALSPFIGAA